MDNLELSGLMVLIHSLQEDDMTNKPKYIAKAGQPWSAQEIAKLKKMTGRMPTRVIGLKLQRPVAGVQAKAQEIGMILKPINKSPRSKLK